jgi:1-deoxy-D-xylulose-5-phosphate reductoisomerase
LHTITLLGSTGSIGRQTLDVVARHPERFRIVHLAAGSNVELAAEQIRTFSPKSFVIGDAAKASALSGAEILTGEDALSRIASDPEVDTVIAAMVGFAGLRPVLEAVKAGKRVCVANKETLVVAGELLTAIAKKTGAQIIPIDSEHSAIAQCLVGEDPRSIKRILLTASGGPFRTRAKDTFSDITIDQALAHPNWVMGRKITIDSATLMNKGLEVIEARWLFDVPVEKIDVIVHPQSIVHSLVEFVDGSVKAQLGAPDMRLPIQYALGFPERINEEYDTLDLLKHNRFDFEAPDMERFPCLGLARKAAELGGVYPCVLNAANEVAVGAFLEGAIRFTEIAEIVGQTMEAAPKSDGRPFDVSTNELILAGLERIYKAHKGATDKAKQLTAELSTITG